MSKFKIIAISKDQKYLMNDSNFEILKKDHPNYEILYKIILNNTTSITSIYNKILKEERASRSLDFVIFQHADIIYKPESLFPKIVNLNDKYDVFGLAGTKWLSAENFHLNWFSGSKRFSTKRIGKIIHLQKGFKQEKYIKSIYGNPINDISDSPVICIDGLFICFGKNALDSKMEFNEKFKFDIYDTDISLQTVLTYKLKLGVIVEDDVKHLSIGPRILQNDFLEHEKILREIWKLDIPSEIKNDKS